MASPASSTGPHLRRFGVFVLNLRTGELSKKDRRLPLQGQPIQILCMLLERPGEVVTRTEIQQRIWTGDTFVDFEGGLNSAMGKLREALSDSAANPRFIETLHRRGYRFIAPVEIPDAPPPEPIRRVIEMPSTEAPAPGRPKALWISAVAAAVVILALLLVLWRRAAPLPPPAITPFTSFPGVERNPSFSPDGNAIAFGWSGPDGDQPDLYVKYIQAGAPLLSNDTALRLTAGPSGSINPKWSPDGRALAFFRESKNGPGKDIVLASPLGAGSSPVIAGTTVGESFDWSPDSKALAIAERGSIVLLSLETHLEKRITSPTGSDADSFPAFSPDGRSIAFRRGSTPWSSDLFTVPVDGGPPQQLTRDHRTIGGLAWTANGRELVFSSNRPGAGRLWRIAATGGEPHLVWGAQGDANDVAISRRGNRLAYSVTEFNANIWRVRVDPDTGQRGAPTKTIYSTRFQSSPQFSPDGTKVAFESDRTGLHQLWITAADGTGARQLTSFDGPLVSRPQWSPDGGRIAVEVHSRGTQLVYIVGPNGGSPQLLETHTVDAAAPAWSADGRSIFFTGGDQIWKTSATGGPSTQITKGGGIRSLPSKDGKILYYAKGRNAPGIWRVPVEGGPEEIVLNEPKAKLWNSWTLAANGIYFVQVGSQDTSPRRTLCFYSFATKQSKPVMTLDVPRQPRWFDGGMSVSSDGKWLLYAQMDQIGSDIMLMENFR